MRRWTDFKRSFFRLLSHLIETKNYNMAKTVGDDIYEEAYDSMWAAWFSGDDSVDNGGHVAQLRRLNKLYLYAKSKL